MGWEKRQRGGDYYYRTARIGGKPRRVYLGTGATGRLHELLDARARRERDEARAARRERDRRLDDCEQLWNAVWPLVRTLAHAGLLLAGWYSHKGEWRKVVGKPRTRQKKPRLAAPAEAAELRAELTVLNDRANAGDEAALKQLRAFLNEHPEVWQKIGDVNALAEESWASLLAEGDALRKESIKRSVGVWKKEMTGADATPTEKALAETAAVARLALAAAESMAASGSSSVAIAEFKIKRLDSAVRRSNATLKLLAQLRSAHPHGLVPAAPPAAGLPRIYSPPDRKTAS